jgi:nicotinate phosphoribosyltransferase
LGRGVEACVSVSDLADEYFNRSYTTVRGTPREERRVCYGVFCREAGRLAGVSDVLDLVRLRGGPGIVVRGKPDGESFSPGEVVLTIEGPFGPLVTLETEYLGMLSASGAAASMAELVEAAGNVPVVDMSARHFPPELQLRLAAAAAIGGAAGTSSRAGHAEVHARFGIGGERIRIGSGAAREFKLYGTIPHALNAVFEGSSIESAAAYHERHPKIPLVVLVDFEGAERDVISAAVQRFHLDLYGIRLDVPGNRIHQGGHDKPVRALEMRILSSVKDRSAAMEALQKYGFGPGVTIESAYATRDLLDSLNAKHTKIVVSSGFDVHKVRAFKACNAPMDFIGTGSWVRFSVFTSDILRVQEDGEWRPRCKAGRAEELREPPDMPVLLST